MAVSFVDCINRGDLDGLAALMTDDHRLAVLDEDPVEGRDENVEAWRGYFGAFPTYVIHPSAFRAKGASVAVLGTTTGSHLGLPDEEEQQLTVLWVAEVVDGRVAEWRILDDTAANRGRYFIDAEPTIGRTGAGADPSAAASP